MATLVYANIVVCSTQNAFSHNMRGAARRGQNSRLSGCVLVVISAPLMQTGPPTRSAAPVLRTNRHLNLLPSFSVQNARNTRQPNGNCDGIWVPVRVCRASFAPKSSLLPNLQGCMLPDVRIILHGTPRKARTLTHTLLSVAVVGSGILALII